MANRELRDLIDMDGVDIDEIGREALGSSMGFVSKGSCLVERSR